ncbi:hypothetical protein CIL05_07725 [Virgibacillus profundi]|uniref:Uncharacterized protein n=1 Tax=Virgibacillus profundi TaxID=2024555 RepID=A0A2A2IEA8_9BACI|nr:hypothetical protein [Virgibacillus profundi]PAV30351.1 hypothetical protein CIL05_07725 [Virgibacillus profundi]PXY54523.1 hypothetical protein CIT14_07810 [Virgibacillus profundi]
MKAEINGIVVEGTPEEIYEYVKLSKRDKKSTKSKADSEFVKRLVFGDLQANEIIKDINNSYS